MTIFAIPQSAPENTSVKDIYKPKKIHDFLCIFFSHPPGTGFLGSLSMLKILPRNKAYFFDILSNRKILWFTSGGGCDARRVTERGLCNARYAN